MYVFTYLKQRMVLVQVNDLRSKIERDLRLLLLFPGCCRLVLTSSHDHIVPASFLIPVLKSFKDKCIVFKERRMMMTSSWATLQRKKRLQPDATSFVFCSCFVFTVYMCYYIYVCLCVCMHVCVCVNVFKWNDLKTLWAVEVCIKEFGFKLIPFSTMFI